MVLGLASCKDAAKPLDPCSAYMHAVRESNAVEIRVTKEGQFWLNNELVTAEELEARLRATAPGDENFVVIPDADSKYGVVARAMALLIRTGHQKCGIIGGT